MHSAVRPLVCRWMVVAATAAGDVGGFSRLPLLATASRECCVHPSLSRMGSGGCRSTVRSLARQRPEPLSTYSFGHPRLPTPASRKREPGRGAAGPLLARTSGKGQWCGRQWAPAAQHP